MRSTTTCSCWPLVRFYLAFYLAYMSAITCLMSEMSWVLCSFEDLTGEEFLRTRKGFLAPAIIFNWGDGSFLATTALFLMRIEPASFGFFSVCSSFKENLKSF
jgi:hypothetical protein